MKQIPAFLRSAAVFPCIFALLLVVTAGPGVSVAVADDGPEPSQSSDKFTDTDIESLFGTMGAEEEKKEEGAPKRVLPPFTGNYKVLVSRPAYAVYEAETKTKWISALGEIYAHYKVGSFPRTQVFTMEQVNSVLSGSRDYARRFSKQHYIEAAKKLGATHLLYQEYQPQKDGKRTRYVMELYWLAEAATVERFSVDIIHSEFEGGLNVCLGKIAEAMDPKAKSSAGFGVQVWNKDLKGLESFGNALADEGRFVKDRAAATYVLVDKAIKKNSGFVGFQYAGALLAGRAESYGQAIQYMETVIGKSKDYPALQLRLAEYLRGAERYSEAAKAAEVAGLTDALRVPASMEMAMISQAQGNLDRARSEYEAILQGGEASGRVLFMLALLSIQMGRISDSEDYLRRAEESGLTLDEGEYLALGQAYAKASGYEEKAIEYLKKSMGAKQSNEDAWEVIAEIYKNTGDAAQEAESYVNLFKINMQSHSGKLKTAGEIFEKLGMTDKAKDAYALFLDRRFTSKDVSMSLARIYFNEQNCKKLPDVLKGYDTIPEATQMLGDCGFKVRKIDESQTMKTKKLSPLMLSLRITGATMLVGGAAYGIIVDQVTIKGLKERYEGYGAEAWERDPNSGARNYEEVKKMREEIDSNMTLRTIMYSLAGVGLGGFAVTFFF